MSARYLGADMGEAWLSLLCGSGPFRANRGFEEGHLGFRETDFCLQIAKK